MIYGTNVRNRRSQVFITWLLWPFLLSLLRPIKPDAEIYNVKPFLGMKKLHEETRDATKSVNALAEADEERRCKVLNQLL